MWAAAEFGVFLRGIHGRNIGSLIRGAETVLDAIGSSFSRALGNTFRQAVAAIFAKEAMDTDKMLKGHAEATVARCAASGREVIVVSQDSTYCNLNGHHSLQGLGLIQGKLKGTLQHNVLAMDQAGTPQAPAAGYFEPVEVKVLQAKAQKPVKTLEQAVEALGKLAGFQKTKRQPLPGVKLMGQALVKLQHMIEGWRLFEKLQNDQGFSLQE